MASPEVRPIESFSADHKLSLKDVGPTVKLDVPLPEPGGITVIGGPNDCGKSLSLDAIGRLFGGNQTVTARDGQPHAGEVRYDDVVLRIGKSTRVVGKAQVLSIEGRLAIIDLVEPKLKDPVAADKARTKALCRLTGAKADPALFYDLLGGREYFDRAVTTAALDTDDLVEMQRMIKRDFEAAARKAEDEAKKAEGEALAANTAIEEIDIKGPCDAAALQQSLEDAITTAQDVRSRKRHAEETSKQAAEAALACRKAMEEYKGPTLERARETADAAEAARAEAQIEEDQARVQLQEAQERARVARENRNLQVQLYADALAHAETIAKWQATIEAGTISGPTEAVMIAAEAAVDAARKAVEQGARIRDARITAQRAVEARASRTAAMIEAERLRDAARDTELVLADVVSADGLTLRDGRWCTEQPGRGSVFFADRSRGTRAAIAIGLVAKRLRELGDGTALVPVPQELWEGMDADNRRKLAVACRELHVNIITAECDSREVGELRAEVYE